MSNSASEIMIQPAAMKNVTFSDTENKDRLSDLPDCVIFHILSFLNTKHAIQTGVLSPRYKKLWQRIPVLILDSSELGTAKIFTKFVSNVLSLRDSSISLHTLDFKSKHGHVEPQIVKKIVDYALSHNVQRSELRFNYNLMQILHSLFSSQTLTYLNLSILPSRWCKPWFPKSLNLPALTNLQLENFIFCIGDDGRAEPFSTFKRLNSLLIRDCAMLDEKTLCISSATLVHLTIYSPFLTYDKFDLCTPSLCTFVFTGIPFRELSGSNVSSLTHVDIHAEAVQPYYEKSPLFLSRWLREFANIKSLTVSASTLQVLSLIPNLSKISPPSFCNLKSLKVKMEELTPEFRLTVMKANLHKAESHKERKRLLKAFKEGSDPLIPNGIVDFLLQNSPSAEVEFIDCSMQPLRARDL